MIAYDVLCAAWRDERARRLARYHRVPAFGPEGLTLGAQTAIGKTIVGNEDRILALLAVAYERPVRPDVIGNLARAAKAIAHGDRSLAAIHIAHAGLEKIGADEHTAFRLFAAEKLLDAGATPRDVMTGLGIDPWPLDLLKANFDPDEPRDAQGRWTGGAGTGDGGPSNMDGAKPDLIADGGTGGPKPTVKAAHGTVEITRPDGSIETRIGGTAAWRNNNPGNIRVDARNFAFDHGAIGKDDNGFAIFPDEATGEAAFRAEMKETGYASKSIDQLIAGRSPPTENDTPHIQSMVRVFSGLPGDAIVGKLNDDQLSRLSAAIRRTEGWRAGMVQHSIKA
jgi:hypothetical protein